MLATSLCFVAGTAKHRGQFHHAEEGAVRVTTFWAGTLALNAVLLAGCSSLTTDQRSKVMDDVCCGMCPMVDADPKAVGTISVAAPAAPMRRYGT